MNIAKIGLITGFQPFIRPTWARLRWERYVELSLALVAVILIGAPNQVARAQALDVLTTMGPLFTSVATAQPNPAQPRYRYWTTNWSFDDINVGTLLSRLQRIGIEIPVAAEGDVSLNFSVSVPLNALRTGKAYRFSGTLRSTRLRVEELQLANFSSDVQYDDGILSLKNLTTRWIDLKQTRTGLTAAAGTLHGDASLALIPRGDLVASVSAAQLSIGPVHDLILSVKQDARSPVMQGLLNGSVALRVPLNQIRELTRWNVKADLTANHLQIDQTTPLTIQTGPVSIETGKIVAPSVTASSPANSAIRLNASIQADLQGDRAFDVAIRGNDLPLQGITKLIAVSDEATVLGKLDVDAKASGTLGHQGIDTATWNVEGRLASPQLTVYGVALGLVQHHFQFDKQHIVFEPLDRSRDQQDAENGLLQRFEANYQINENEFNLNDLQASIFGGTISGAANIARTSVGEHHIDMHWANVAPQINTHFILPGAVTVRAQTSGNIQWTMPAAEVDRPATHRGTARVSIEQLAIGRETLGNATLQLQAGNRELQLTGEGNLFGGTFSVETASQLTAETTWWGVVPTSLNTNRLSTLSAVSRFHSISLGQANRLLAFVPRSIDGWISGEVNLQLASTENETDRYESQALLALDNLAIDQQLLTRRINADLKLSDVGLQIRSLRGSYAGGQVDATGFLALPSLNTRVGNLPGQVKRDLPWTGRLQVRLAAIDTSKGLLLISPGAASWAGGKLSGAVSIDSGATIRARGRLALQQSMILTMPIGDAHASLMATVPLDFARWRVTLGSIESTVGYGRVTGEATLSSSYRAGAFDLESNWNARRLDFGNLLDEVAGSGSNYTRGNLDGRLTLSGSGIRSVNDLNGYFSAELDGSQGRSVPGLDSAQAYLGAFSLADTRFEEGGIRGSIRGGFANIEDFWLMSNRVQVVADGRVALASGYTDIDAVISTGNFDVANVALLSIAEPLALEAAWPIGLAVRANQFLSDRTLYVQLTGPAYDPRLRLKPLDTLRQGARRFLVREAISSVAPFATAGGSLLTNDR